MRRLILDWPCSRSRNEIGRLADRQPEVPGSVDELDLEAVAVRGDRGRRDLLERLPPVDPEAARGVVDVEPQTEPRVQVPRPGQRDPSPAPVRDRTTRDVAAPDHQVMPFGRPPGDEGAPRAGATDPSPSRRPGRTPRRSRVRTRPRRRSRDPTCAGAPPIGCGDRPPNVPGRSRPCRRASRRRRPGCRARSPSPSGRRAPHRSSPVRCRWAGSRASSAPPAAAPVRGAGVSGSSGARSEPRPGSSIPTGPSPPDA